MIVKTATRDGALSLVAIMRKVRAGGAPSSWRYAEYTRSRSGDGFTKVGGGQALCRELPRPGAGRPTQRLGLLPARAGVYGVTVSGTTMPSAAWSPIPQKIW